MAGSSRPTFPLDRVGDRVVLQPSHLEKGDLLSLCWLLSPQLANSGPLGSGVRSHRKVPIQCHTTYGAKQNMKMATIRATHDFNTNFVNKISQIPLNCKSMKLKSHKMLQLYSNHNIHNSLVPLHYKEKLMVCRFVIKLTDVWNIHILDIGTRKILHKTKFHVSL